MDWTGRSVFADGRTENYYRSVSDRLGGGDKGFLCIEPQCGEVNGLNSDAHRELAAGETETFVMTIKRKCQ
jgi:galactose mutarotase-like enzyme